MGLFRLFLRQMLGNLNSGTVHCIRRITWRDPEPERKYLAILFLEPANKRAQRE